MNSLSRQQGVKLLGEIWSTFCEQGVEDAKLEDLLPDVEAGRRAHRRLMERVRAVCGVECRSSCECIDCIEHWHDYCIKVGKVCDFRGKKAP